MNAIRSLLLEKYIWDEFRDARVGGSNFGY